MKILLVIPAYNEEQNIERVVDNLISHYGKLDYIIINDGSSDKTAQICKERHYKIINLPVNLGLAGAFQTGMKYAYRHNYDAVVQFDGDGQHRAEYVYDMAREMEKGYDIVILSRYKEKKQGLSLKYLGSHMISLAIFLTTGQKIKDPTSGMRMYNRTMVEEFASNLNFPPEPDTISYLIKQGKKVVEVQGEMDERTGGVSYLTPINICKYMLRMLVSILFIQNFRKKV